VCQTHLQQRMYCVSREPGQKSSFAKEDFCHVVTFPYQLTWHYGGHTQSSKHLQANNTEIHTANRYLYIWLDYNRVYELIKSWNITAKW